MRLRVFGGVLLLVLTSCSGESETPQTTTSAAPGQVSTTIQSTTPPPATTVAPTAATTTAAPAVPAALTAMTAAAPAAATLEVAVEGSMRPSITWDAAAGADQYIAIVVDDAGTVLWTWAGAETAVTIGAGEVDRAGAGARLVRPGWLQVVAFGADGIAAVSAAIPVG